MKGKMLAILLLAAVLLKGLPFRPTDIAGLKPLVAVRIDYGADGYEISTDTGDQGEGDTISDAFRDLQAHCEGEIFPDTAQFVVVTKAVLPVPEELYECMRPSCALCLEEFEVSAEQAASYLTAHRPGITLADFRAEGGNLPVLRRERGGMVLDQGKSS